ncbi:MAG: hypothetical protein KIT80_02615 [Chitinophagaceae bacterium]|nr:hypothetical protein [Chitinophagaceae bacterium]MCW5925779.1 hypothetical protein [Chitinophagaceae bacterium]
MIGFYRIPGEHLEMFIKNNIDKGPIFIIYYQKFAKKRIMPYIKNYLFLLLGIALTSCNFSNRILFDEENQCIKARRGALLNKFDISTTDGLYHFKVNEGVKNNISFCVKDYEKLYSVYATYPKNLSRKFQLPLNSPITFNNYSYGDMASFEMSLFVDSMGIITLIK